jgi:hypothetical protein
MEIRKIFLPTCDGKLTQFVDDLLKRHIFNDRLFETYCFTANVILDSPVQLFYRTLWEQVYLKTKDAVMVISKDNSVQLRLSMSECIQYIQKATPPAFQDKLKDELTSVQSVYDMMNMYLMDTKSDRYGFNLTLFYRVFHLEIFETNFIPDYKKIAFARDRIKEYPYGEILGLVDVSSKSIAEIIADTKWDQLKTYVQMTFHVDTEDDIVRLYHYLWKNDLEICDLHCEDIGLFVSAYATHVTPSLAKMIEMIYKQFM